jgi:ribosome-binding factor A
LFKKIYIIQQSLNRRLRMRPVPRIRFTLDEEELRREKVERSLAALKRKGDL